MTAQTPHHHGNLREGLIEAGLALLIEGGTTALTLRRAAARAGVSHAAPAHHFDGLGGLLTAMAARAYRDFTKAMTARRDQAAPGAFAALVGVSQGYLDFAQTRAGLFHLIFVSPEVDRTDPEVMTASFQAYQVLREACLPFSPTAAPDPVIETAVWSAVHGYALLGLNLPDSPKRSIVAIPPIEALLARIVPPPRETRLPLSGTSASQRERSAGVAQG